MTRVECGPVAEGPLPEEGTLTAGLDYYKLTMSQLHYEQHPDVDVTFTFNNRDKLRRLEDHVSTDDLEERLQTLRERNWQPEEIEHFASLKDTEDNRVFPDLYLGYLVADKLPDPGIRHDEATDDIASETTGKAPRVTFWETIIMSQVNENYFENYVRDNGIDLRELYKEGNRRLTEKIEILRENPDIKFADFGTRRRFSLRWHKHVLERLQDECPENLLGTSNIALARTLNMPLIGTFAHEMPMIYAGIADAMGRDIRQSHGVFLDNWEERYPDLNTALTDTFGSEFFFTDFTHEQAEKWKGLRHDSGDPYEFGEKVIEFYENEGIDPLEKTIVFSDGLDINTIVELHKYFKGRINIVFGWGTTLTNDLGLKALNIVDKATHVRLPDGREADTVKLSDNEGKHTGPEEKVKEYQNVFGKIAIAA